MTIYSHVLIVTRRKGEASEFFRDIHRELAPKNITVKPNPTRS